MFKLPDIDIEANTRCVEDDSISISNWGLLLEFTAAALSERV